MLTVAVGRFIAPVRRCSQIFYRVPAMSEIISVAPSQLIVDVINPRLPNANLGQRESLQAMAENQGKKLVSLAKDLVQFGINKSDLMIVMADETGKRYIVLEGNRRLTALKGLENPDVFKGVISKSEFSSLKKQSDKYNKSPIDSINCWKVDTREEAEHWISLRHTGQNDGAGIVPWASLESDRFSARSGKTGIHTQALDFIKSQGVLDEGTLLNVPVTSFSRLLSTPDVRSVLGVDVVNGELVLTAGKKKVAGALAHVAKDLAQGKTVTKDI